MGLPSKAPEPKASVRQSFFDSCYAMVREGNFLAISDALRLKSPPLRLREPAVDLCCPSSVPGMKDATTVETTSVKKSSGVGLVSDRSGNQSGWVDGPDAVFCIFILLPIQWCLSQIVLRGCTRLV